MQRSDRRGSNARPSTSRYSARPSPYNVSGHGHGHHHRSGDHPHTVARHDGHHHVRQEAQQAAPTAPQCGICSYTQPYPADRVRVYHHHFSSLQLREVTGVEASGKGYLCPSCKSSHRPYTEDRIKLVVGDSTVHEFFAPQGYGATHYKGDLVHVDYITIKDGYIHELLDAFRLEYEHHQQAKPLDVVLVAGYADLLSGHSRDFILEGFKHFTDRVLAVGAKLAPQSKSTVAIASMMYPPKLAWFRDNGPEPFNYHNQKEKINWLNGKIDQINHDNAVPVYPGFHSYGIRVDTTTTTTITGEKVKHTTKAHRWGHWLEGPRREKFSLHPNRRFKMGTALNNYFLYRT